MLPYLRRWAVQGRKPCGALWVTLTPGSPSAIMRQVEELLHGLARTRR